MAIVSDDERGRLVRLEFDPVAGALVSPPAAYPLRPGAATSPQPSPDGSSIAYTAHSPEEDLAIVATGGSQEPRLLTNDEFVDRVPKWSPDGRHIAFQSNRSGRMEVWTVRPDGSDFRQLTKTTNGNAVSPVWSPDGSQLAYSVEGAGAYVIAADGESPSEALPAAAEGGAFQPSSWSPDGTTLAGSAAGVVLYSIRDRTYRRITDFGGQPVWLGDGHQLVFASERSIFIVSSDGGTPREIYSAAPCELLPVLGVSADGRSIYASLTTSAEELWIADLPQ
jgi:Tol biopolymer transport system component